MSGILNVPGLWPVIDVNGDPVSGATINFYEPGTTTPKAVYSDATLATSLGTQLTTNAGGEPTTLAGAIARLWWGPTGVSYDIQVTAGAATRTWSDVFIGQGSVSIDLRDFGAKCDGTTADDAAWAAVFAANPNGFFTLTWPGFTRITTPITPPAGCSNVIVSPNGGAAIMATGTHAHTLLNLPSTVFNWQVYGVKFFTGSANSVSQNWAIVCAGDSCSFEQIRMTNVHSGLRVTGPKFYGKKIYGSAFKAVDGIGINIAQATTGTEVVEIENIFLESDPAAKPQYGVLVEQASACYLQGLATQFLFGLVVQPGNGQVVATLDLDFEADNCQGAGITFSAAGTGAVQRVSGFLRSTSNAGDGVDFVVPPASSDLQLRVADNGVRGVRLRAVDQKNSRLKIMAGGNGTHGFEADSGATRFRAEIMAGPIDDFGTNGQYGAVIGASCDNFTVTVDGQGGTTGQIFNGAGTSATKVVTTRV